MKEKAVTKELELAREIMSTKKVHPTNHIPIDSDAKELIQYKDEYIEIIAARDTQVLYVEIFHPLTTDPSNPIIYVDDENQCYRNHGERGSFIMYAERLLGKELTIGKYHKEEQDFVDELFEKKNLEEKA